jgi:peptidoglycan hydrolase-like protein with peptidoglycan-binding domain
MEGNSGPHGGVNRHDWSAPQGTGNSLICGVINAAKLVTFDGNPPPPDPHDDIPPFPGRSLMLKSPPMTGNDVLRWQSQMKHRGWSLDANSHYDARTHDVCVQFQHQKGLPETGTVGAQTWTAAWTAPVTPE